MVDHAIMADRLRHRSMIQIYVAVSYAGIEIWMPCYLALPEIKDNGICIPYLQLSSILRLHVGETLKNDE